jgi:hypothetical protein
MSDPWNDPRPRQGWMWFVCAGPDGCGRAWRETARDSTSGSCESCSCLEIVYPVKSEVDSTVKVDEFANLVEHQVVELVRPRAS